MTNYLLIQFVLSTLLIAIYHFLHRERNQHGFNRVFLNGSLLFSAVVPVIKIDAFPIHQAINVNIPINRTSSELVVVSNNTLISFDMIYGAIATIICLYTLIRILQTLRSMKLKHQLSQTGNYLGSPMSFLNYIAVPDENDKIVVAHEQYHAMAGHSIDRVLFSFFHAFLWINPILFIYRRFLIENHELAADQYSINANQIDTSSYAEHLVSITKQHIKIPNAIPIPNHYHSLILNRIKMLQIKKTKSTLANFLSLGLLALLFCSFTLKSYTITTIDSDPIGLVNDTIPEIKTLINVDTITVFDIKNKTEKVQIVKAGSKTLEDYLNSLHYSGEMITRTDTITTFDYDTYEEHVKVIDIEYPIEIRELLKKTNYIDHDLIIEMAKKSMK